MGVNFTLLQKWVVSYALRIIKKMITYFIRGFLVEGRKEEEGKKELCFMKASRSVLLCITSSFHTLP